MKKEVKIILNTVRLYIGITCLCYVIICLVLCFLTSLFFSYSLEAKEMTKVMSLPLAIVFVILFVRCRPLSPQEKKEVPLFRIRFQKSDSR